MNINPLVEAINAFDTFYEMSDSPIKWQLGSQKLSSIKANIKSLDKKEVLNLKTQLNKTGQINFDRYLKKHL